MPDFLRVKDFDRFQHYRDRTPPWIKLYNSVLDDYAFACLPDADKWHLVAIWLLASRTDNRVPFDAEWISQRINARSPINLKSFISSGFLDVEHDASAALAQRSDGRTDNGAFARSRETETEGERETEGEKKENSEASPLAAPPPLDARAQLWRDGPSIVIALTGKPESACRKLLGKWMRDADDDAGRLLTVLRNAQRDQILDLVPWVEKCLKPRRPSIADDPEIFPPEIYGHAMLNWHPE